MVNWPSLHLRCTKLVQVGLFSLLIGLCANVPAIAQSNPAQAPGLFDAAAQIDTPDLSNLRPIRFLTENDYPPLHFTRSDGELAGFNIDVARELCLELKVQCTVQPWRWDKLNEALSTNAGDAIIASVRPTREAAATQIFSVPYYVTPARFVTLKGSKLSETSPATLADKTIAVVAGSAHEAYFKLAFPKAKRSVFLTLQEAQTALVSGQVDALFGDGLTLSIWLGQDQGSPCTFVGGAYFDNGFFGEGARIAFRQEDEALRLAVNYGLRKLSARGVLAELYWKYFPIGYY